VVDELDYPVLFGTTQATWAPIDLRFELLTGKVDLARVVRVYIVPFVGDACVVIGSSTATGDRRAAVGNRARASGRRWSGSWPRRPEGGC
jgi:hypothetical protein